MNRGRRPREDAIHCATVLDSATEPLRNTSNACEPAESPLACRFASATTEGGIGVSGIPSKPNDIPGQVASRPPRARHKAGGTATARSADGALSCSSCSSPVSTARPVSRHSVRFSSGWSAAKAVASNPSMGRDPPSGACKCPITRPHIRSVSTAAASATVSNSASLKRSSSASFRRWLSGVSGAWRRRLTASCRVPRLACACARRKAASGELELSGSSAASAANAQEYRPCAIRGSANAVSAMEFPSVEVMEANHPAEPGEPAGVEVEPDPPYADRDFLERQRNVEVGPIHGENAWAGDDLLERDPSSSPAPAPHGEDPHAEQEFKRGGIARRIQVRGPPGRVAQSLRIVGSLAGERGDPDHDGVVRCRSRVCRQTLEEKGGEVRVGRGQAPGKCFCDADSPQSVQQEEQACGPGRESVRLPRNCSGRQCVARDGRSIGSG